MSRLLFPLALVLSALLAGLAAHVSPASAQAPTNVPYLSPAGQIAGPASEAYSYNWSGYIADVKHVNTVEGSWVVQKARKTRFPTFSSQWIGVGGYQDETLIQVGTESDWNSGHVYHAWVELLPDAESVIPSLAVHTGDVMRASISLDSDAANLWDVSIVDLTSGQGYQTAVTYASTRRTADWVEERPMIGFTLAELAHFRQAQQGQDYTSALFSDQASNGHGLLPIGQLKHVVPVGMLSDSGKYVISRPEALSTDGSSWLIDRLFNHKKPRGAGSVRTLASRMPH